MQLIRGKLLKQIFADHYESFAQLHPKQIKRAGIPRNVDKMLKCRTEDMGFHLWQCPNCRYEKRVLHTCKSRFCSSCGVRQTDTWIETYATLFAECEYQHVIFSPPHEFLNYFRVGRRKYFNCLYSVVNQTLTGWCSLIKHNKPYYLPGFMANTNIVKEVPDEFDPFLWKCDLCGKEKQFTEEEIDKTKKPYPDPQNHPHDFYIICPFCTKGVMEPPELVFFGGAFEDFDKE